MVIIPKVGTINNALSLSRNTSFIFYTLDTNPASHSHQLHAVSKQQFLLTQDVTQTVQIALTDVHSLCNHINPAAIGCKEDPKARWAVGPHCNLTQNGSSDRMSFLPTAWWDGTLSLFDFPSFQMMCGEGLFPFVSSQRT